MAKKKLSQKLLLDHSKAKVELLEKYLDKYLNIIANNNYTKKIRVFDLFCGEGEYKNGKEGSPLVILRRVNDLNKINKAKNKKIPPVDILFNDLDKDSLAKLKFKIDEKKLHKSEFGDLQFRNLDYKEIVDKLPGFLKKMRDQKAFIFIDPYGYKEISALDIKSLMQNKKSEVLLFLPTQFMYRFDKSGTPQSLKTFISEIVDIKEWKSTTSVWNFIEQLKSGFRSYLGVEYFVDTFTIQKDPQTVFCLFFFSSHIRGFEKMLESKWELDNEKGKGWSYEKTIGMFASEEKNVLEEKLIKFIKSNKRYNGEVYEFTLRNGFLPKHTTEIFKHLTKENKLLVLSANNTKLHGKATYVNYHNFKNAPKRVYFKI